MSKQHFNSRAPLTESLGPFQGIISPSAKTKHSPRKVINFRIGEDGSLQKRCGTRALFKLPDSIRSHWSGYLGGNFQVYLLAGKTLYLADLKKRSYTALGNVSTETGPANFFCLQGTLYLNDGENLFSVRNHQLCEALGYVPLYGKDWDNDEMGEVNEPMNILNPYVRITYHVSAPPSIFLRVPKTIRSVEAVFRNGVRLTDEEFHLNREFNTIDVSNLSANDRLEAYLSFEHDNDEIRRLFCSTQGSVFFGAPNQSRTFFFGAEKSDTVFCTENVAPDALDHACRIYDSDPLYLPEGYEFRIGEQRHPIHGALCHKDNLLIFTEGDTWLGSVDSTGHTALPSILVNEELGCLSSQGYVLAQNDPITIGRHGLYLWHSSDPELTQRDTIRISQAIEHLFSPADLKHASLFYEAMRDELWLNLPTKNEIWIHSMKRDDWFCFTEISADRFFDADGEVGFFSGNTVSIFDPTTPYDLTINGGCYSVLAVYESAPIDFGTPEKKNLSSVRLSADLDGSAIAVKITTAQGKELQSVDLNSTVQGHNSLAKRSRSARFQTAFLEISCEDPSLPVIHSLTLTAH